MNDLYGQDPRNQNNSSLKNSKIANNKSNLKGTTQLSRNKVMSQSLSFPSKGARNDSIRKSIDGLSVKSDVKHARGNGSNPERPSNGGVNSVSLLSHPNKAASSSVKSKQEIMPKGASSRSTSLASMPSFKRSMVRTSSFFLFVFC